MAGEPNNIFISYRRDESAGYAGRIGDSFVEHFGEDRVFRDIDSIEPGLDFAEAIESAIARSGVLIAVIGRNWLTVTDAAGQRRLENPDDYVRIEIATALKRNIRVIPLLVQGAAMPSAAELPDDLAPLTRRNAFELHDTSWKDEVRRLITTLDKVLGRRREEPVEKPMEELVEETVEGPGEESVEMPVGGPVRRIASNLDVPRAVLVVIKVLVIILSLLLFLRLL